MKDSSDTQIPPKIVVRIIAALLFLVASFLLFLGIVYLQEWGLLVSGFIILGAVSTQVMTIEAFITGNPEWILLHLIIAPW